MSVSAGDYSYGTPQIRWACSGANYRCGKFCSIAGNVTIYLGGNHRPDWITTYPFGHINKETFHTFDGKGHPATKGDVTIGNDVWVGDNSTIMSGITIGDGAVIANNSHVVKDVRPYSIVGGNPAREIKLRFTEEQIETLLKIQWWNWPIAKINAFLPTLCSGNIKEFLEKAAIPQA
uniref:Acetyltransferase n=1 Tax=viral metagenome TaxID=1070528 RepID=A0A6C0DPN8_9ZZZZ